jgi:hypothetical protein
MLRNEPLPGDLVGKKVGESCWVFVELHTTCVLRRGVPDLPEDRPSCRKFHRESETCA